MKEEKLEIIKKILKDKLSDDWSVYLFGRRGTDKYDDEIDDFDIGILRKDGQVTEYKIRFEIYDEINKLSWPFLVVITDLTKTTKEFRDMIVETGRKISV